MAKAVRSVGSLPVPARALRPPTRARATQQRRGHNVAAVGVANKLARIVWAVWTHQRPYDADYRPTVTRQTSITSSPQEDCTELN